VADVVDRLATASAGFSKAVEAAATSNGWNAPSPCEGWTAGDVIDHLTGNYIRLADELGFAMTPSGDRRADWLAARARLFEALSPEGALDSLVHHPNGQMPLGQFVAVFVTTDTLVHTWDVARAVGGDESLDEDLCRRCYERSLPADKTLRALGVFGPKVDYADDDPIQIKLLRFYGRRT
jgi:uncharacterized protein (TIGR03086 family)